MAAEHRPDLICPWNSTRAPCAFRHLRIVPDDTQLRFHALPAHQLSDLGAAVDPRARRCIFTIGLNFGIDFKGGTLIEVQAKSGAGRSSRRCARRSSELGLGEVQLQEFGGADDVLIRVAQQPGGDAAQQAVVSKVRGALGDSVEYRRVEVVGPRVSQRAARPTASSA